jgi:putative transposase
MDLCSRKIIGYAYGKSMTTGLAVQAVENACLNVRDTKGIILHSDLGSQYTSQAFEDCLSKKGSLHSYSRKGNPYDNACIESFHSVLKKEEIYLHTYQDSKEARRAIFEYIEGWYNRKRIHSSIDYLTPQQKEDEELKKQHNLSTFFVQSIDTSPMAAARKYRIVPSDPVPPRTDG